MHPKALGSKLHIYLTASLVVILILIGLTLLTDKSATNENKSTGFVPIAKTSQPLPPPTTPKATAGKKATESDGHSTPAQEQPALVRVGQRVEFAATIIADGMPVPGARVAASIRKSNTITPFENIAYSRQSELDGVAIGEVICPSDQPEESLCSVAAYHPEYGSAYAELELGELRNSSFENIVLELEKGHVIVGQVVDLAESPVPGAIVTLYTMCPTGGLSLSSLSVKTASDGSFVMAGIQFDNTPNHLRVAYRPPISPDLPKGLFGRPLRPATISSERMIIRDLFDENRDSTEVPDIRLPLNLYDLDNSTVSDEG